MRKRTVVSVLAFLLTSNTNIQIARAVDSRAIMDNEFNKIFGGKRSHKIELECIFEENRAPLRFTGTFNTTSEYIDEGTGTEAGTGTDKGPTRDVTFKRRRSDSKNYGRLYIYYTKTDTLSTTYQIDETFKIFAVRQQNAKTDPFPFTDIYVGTCSGIF